MTSASKTVYVVDRNPTSSTMLSEILTFAGYDVVCFVDGGAMASTARTAIPACILFDLPGPGSSGIDMLRRLNAPAYPAPVLIMSDEAGIAMVIALIRDGAYDFLEKPFSATELVQRIERAKLLFVYKTPSAHKPLTSREQEVLTQWVGGATTKEIARKFGISPRTIDVHRAKIMKKLNAKNSSRSSSPTTQILVCAFSKTA